MLPSRDFISGYPPAATKARLSLRSNVAQKREKPLHVCRSEKWASETIRY